MAGLVRSLEHFFAHRDDILREIEEDRQYAATMWAALGEGPLAKKLKSAG